MKMHIKQFWLDLKFSTISFLTFPALYTEDTAY